MSNRLPDLSEIYDLLVKMKTDTEQTAITFCESRLVKDAEAKKIIDEAKALDSSVGVLQTKCRDAMENPAIDKHVEVINMAGDLRRRKDLFLTTIANAESAHPLKH